MAVHRPASAGVGGGGFPGTAVIAFEIGVDRRASETRVWAAALQWLSGERACGRGLNCSVTMSARLA